MYILAFETSCDDTSVAVLQDNVVLSLSTHTQLEHDSTGGVVPEVAARSHANAIFNCMDCALKQANISLQDIYLLACTKAPGLAPSLLIGTTVAQTLSSQLHIPCVWVNHIEAHIFANFLERNLKDIPFPSIVLTLSGGHTELYLWEDLFTFTLLGQTQDDAVGEAYDKVAKMMGMGFPGGAKVAMLAELFREKYVNMDVYTEALQLFPRALLQKGSLDFSFSGLKSAVKRYISSREILDDFEKMRIAFAFEEAVFAVLESKFFAAAKEYAVGSCVLAGGVSANTMLKQRLQQHAQECGIRFVAPVKNVYSQDNAAMVGIFAYFSHKFS